MRGTGSKMTRSQPPPDDQDRERDPSTESAAGSAGWPGPSSVPPDVTQAISSALAPKSAGGEERRPEGHSDPTGTSDPSSDPTGSSPDATQVVPSGSPMPLPTPTDVTQGPRSGVFPPPSSQPGYSQPM